MFKKILWTRIYKAGYKLIRGIVDASDYGGEDFEMTSAFNHNGDYIGDSKTAYRLCKKRGIKPELIDKNHTVCSIGFCEQENRWYGWSHRAICGFGLGDKIFEEEFGNEQTPFVSHGNKTINNIADARLSAIQFALCVS